MKSSHTQNQTASEMKGGICIDLAREVGHEPNMRVAEKMEMFVRYPTRL